MGFGNGKKDGWLVKINSDGAEDWDVTFGGPRDEELYDALELEDGNIALIGYTASQGKGKEDMWFLITDNEGNIIYNETFGGDKEDKGTRLMMNYEGDFLLMGYTKSKGPGKCNMWVMRFKPELQPKEGARGRAVRPKWDRYVGGAKYESANQIFINPLDTMIYVLGQSSTYTNGAMDLYLVTISDELGRVKERKNYGGKQYDTGNDFIINEDGSMMLFGSTMSGSNGLFDGYVSFIFKDHFYQEWYMNYGGEKDDHFTSAVATDKGFLIAGYTSSEGAGGYDGWLVHIDKEGKVIWSETIGDVNNEKLAQIIKTDDGGYLLCGHTYDDEAGKEMWVIKLAK
jgi:hypothetical protein